MADFKAAKVVAALPATLEADTVYFIRVGSGFDIKVTNGTGTIVALDLNQLVASAFGKLLIAAEDAADGRSKLGLGTAATRNVGNAYGNIQLLGSDPPTTLPVGGCGTLPTAGFSGATQTTEADAVAANLPALGGAGTVERAWSVITGGRTTRAVQYATEVFGIGGMRGRTFIRVKHDSTWHPWREILTDSNLLQSTGQSTKFPMSQKAVTDAIYARGFADASGVLTSTSGALSNAVSNLLSKNTNAELRASLELGDLATKNAGTGLSVSGSTLSVANATATVQGGLKARLSGTTLYLTNNGTNP